MRSFIAICICLAFHSARAQSKTYGFTLHPSLVALQVTNLDSSMAWYQKFLGFAQRDQRAFPDHDMRIGFMVRDGFELELVEYKLSVSREELLRNYPQNSQVRGFAKLTFRVDDIRLADEYLTRQGVKYIFRLQTSNDPSKPGQQWLVISDPDGNWIQLVSAI